MGSPDASVLSVNELQSYLLEHIPVTKHMDLRVERSNLESVVLSAPLEPNVNHRDTVFGGSASALAMLAGWGLVYLHFREWPSKTRIVIQRNQMEFYEPIKGHFEARCESPGEAAWDKTRSTLKRWDKARIHLDVELTVGDEVVGEFEGAYVIECPQ